MTEHKHNRNEQFVQEAQGAKDKVEQHGADARPGEFQIRRIDNGESIVGLNRKSTVQQLYKETSLD